MSIAQRLGLLRAAMQTKGIDAVIVPTADPHQSEYIPAFWQEREWISGFTGSAGLVVVEKDHAALWTDSRYFLQAEMELRETGVLLQKMVNQFGSPYIDDLAERLPEGSTVGVNGFLFSRSSVEAMQARFTSKGIHLNYRCDIFSDIWENRPELSSSPISCFEDQYTGQSLQDKLNAIRSELGKNGAQNHLITALDDLAWTFNIRGKDVEFNPVSLGYAIIGETIATIFIDEFRLTPKVKSAFKKAGVSIRQYNELISFLSNMKEHDTILIDPYLCSMAVYESVNATIVHGPSIAKKLKAIKNEKESQHIRQAMRKDGAALAATFFWLENALNHKENVTEFILAQKLAEFRATQKLYQGESFSAIVGYKSNGAIIHYRPEEETSARIASEGILLVDSGGQYLDGTTDITRTFALSQPSDEQKTAYTLILKGLIALSRAIFPEGTMGVQLDTLARQFLWSHGLNYGHGTGHGVGFYLNVHEPPQGFAPGIAERGKTIHEPGMLSSNEPGFYKTGEFGIRLENLILVEKSSMQGFLQFETVTLYPFDHTLIQDFLLTREEKDWINTYHKKVYSQVSPLLTADIKLWFKDKCRRLK